MRSSAKMLVNDARRLRGTDMDAVAERLAATIRLGEHASRGSIVIGSLVGMAIMDLARVETDKLLQADELNAQQAKVINDAFDRVLTDDPYHGLEAVETEKVMMVAWIKSEYQGENAGKELAKLFQYDTAAMSKDQRRLSQLNGKQVATLADETSRAYDEMIDAWQAEDPVGELQRVEVKLEEGKYGLVSKFILPALGNFRKRMIESEQNLQRLRSELTAVEEGE